MDQPKVSVIVPVYNGEKYLRTCLDTVAAQTLRDIQIICINDGSKDSTLDILREYQAKDERFLVLSQENQGTGPSRNRGLAHATGKYISFLDADDLFRPEMLERAYSHAEAHQAEITAYDAHILDDATQTLAPYTAVRWERLPDKPVFTGRELTRDCFRAFDGALWDKLFLRQFLLDNDLRFFSQSILDDVTFGVMAVVSARRITAIPDKLVYYRKFDGSITTKKVGKLELIYSALTQLKKWLERTGHWEWTRRDFVNLSIEYIMKLFYDLDDTLKKECYQKLHGEYLGQLGLTEAPLAWFNKPHQYFEVQRIAAFSYEQFCRDLAPGCSVRRHSPELIVSLTSYPQRIQKAHMAVRDLLCQSEKPDRLILWLAEEEFPNREADLPEKLLELKQYGLTVAWCQNIKAYKKLIPALQQYPDAVIATADDDMRYNWDWLKLLWESYQKQPDCIHCHRPAMLEIKGGQFRWTTNGKRYYPQATYLHKCISHAGILYPPRCLHPDVFHEVLFTELAETNDDLWFWFMAIRSGTKIRAAEHHIPTPRYVDGTQDVSLSQLNEGKDGWFERDLKKMLNKYPEVGQMLREEFLREH